MKLNITSILIIITFFSATYAQKNEPGFGIKFGGFLKTDIIYDSRQNVTLREGHFSLYPENEFIDKKGEDINAKANFNILSIQSRLTGNIYGPDAFGAKSSGVLEAEFFGTADGDVNGFRLRHAFGKLDWENASLLIGQTWHPMFVPEMFPAVISFNTGAPFQPFSRNPQVRFSYRSNAFKLILAALSQRDFQSYGPAGLSSAYLRNSVIPNLNAQFQFSGDGLFAGAGVDYKTLTPRLVTPFGYKTDASVSAVSVMGYTKIEIQPLIIKLQGIYGANLADHIQLGGYAVKEINPVDSSESYTHLKNLSIWGEILTGKQIEYGLFVGYTKALGADDNIVGKYYGRGTNIDHIFRVAPRIQFNSEKNRIGIEIEYTSAGYGTANSLNKGKVENVKNISNLRVLTAYYHFF